MYKIKIFILSAILFHNSFLKFYKFSKHKLVGSYNEITSNLWIGDCYSALNSNFLENNNIKLIINCSKNLKFNDFKHIKKLRIPINDDRSNESNIKMIKYFNKYYHIIDNFLKANKGVLIHCRMGCQRSATLVALYLMKKKNINFKQAKQIIRSKRYYAFFPLVNFHKILLKM
jgi:protein-tyrosine phosphatase